MSVAIYIYIYIYIFLFNVSQAQSSGQTERQTENRELTPWTAQSDAGEPKRSQKAGKTLRNPEMSQQLLIPTVTLYKISDISFDIESCCYVILVLYSDILCDKIWRGRGGEETLMKSRALRSLDFTRVILSSSSLLPVGVER